MFPSCTKGILNTFYNRDFSPSFFWTRNERAPSGVTSEATQRCCENNCHNVHYHDQAEQNCERKTPGSWQTLKQETQQLKKTRERHRGTSAVLLQTVQTESKLPLCVSNSLLGTQRDFRVSALCVEDNSSHHSTPPFDAIEATIIDAIDATQAINSSHFPFAHSRNSVGSIASTTCGAITVHEHLFEFISASPPISSFFTNFVSQPLNSFAINFNSQLISSSFTNFCESTHQLVLHKFCETTHQLVLHLFLALS